jgi:hypothetical protein
LDLRPYARQKLKINKEVIIRFLKKAEDKMFTDGIKKSIKTKGRNDLLEGRQQKKSLNKSFNHRQKNIRGDKKAVKSEKKHKKSLMKTER